MAASVGSTWTTKMTDSEDYEYRLILVVTMEDGTQFNQDKTDWYSSILKARGTQLARTWKEENQDFYPDASLSERVERRRVAGAPESFLPDLTLVDDPARVIRYVDGAHSLGAGALSESLMPFIAKVRAEAWDEGYEQRMRDYPHDMDGRTNPYRKGKTDD